MLRFSITTALCFVSWAAISVVAHGGMLRQEEQRVPGTGVRLVVPAGFEPSGSFFGFLDVDTGASLFVAEFPGPFSEVIQEYNDPATLAKRGMKVLSRVRRGMGDHSGLLFHIAQATAAVDVEKWMWCFGNEQQSAMLMGTCPVDFVEERLGDLRTAVLSAKWDPDFEPDPLEGVPFSLLDTGGLRLHLTMPGTLGYSLDGEVDKSGRKPLFLCSSSIAGIGLAGDRRKFSEDRLKQTAHHHRFTIDETEPVEIDGLRGFATRASAEDREGDVPKAIYQVMLFEGNAYWFMQGLVAADENERYGPIFERMAQSFRRKRETLSSPPGGPSITIPAIWSMRGGLNDEADLQAGHPIAGCFLIVLSEPKTDYEEGTTLEDFGVLTREWLDEMLATRTGPTETRVGDRRAQRAEYIPDDSDEAAFLHVAVDGPTGYHQLVFWADTNVFEDCRSEFDQILATFSEVR